MDASAIREADRLAGETIGNRIAQSLEPLAQRISTEFDRLNRTIADDETMQRDLHKRLSDAALRLQQVEEQSTQRIAELEEEKSTLNKELGDRPQDPDAIAEVAIGVIQERLAPYFTKLEEGR